MPGVAAAEVDFERDVRPIFEAHCVECHSALETNGGLRLDRRAYAFMGGDSGVSALSDDLEQSPIWQRVTATDPEDRMPYDGDPLPEAELAVLRAWIEAGASWPSETTREVVIDFDSQIGREQAAANDVSARYLTPKTWFASTYLRPLAPWLFVGLLGVFVLERLRGANREGKGWAQGRLGAWAGRRSGAALFAGLLALLSGALGVALVQVAVDSDAAWRKQHAPRDVYGDPPEPFRPAHGRRVSGTYWRGNCERHPELFNGGYYTTALLHLDLCDAAGARVDYGDPLPDPVYARLRIERAPNANAALFRDAMLQRVLLTREAGTHEPDPRPADAVNMEVVRSRAEWEARFALEPDPATHRDRVYVYSDVAHYAIDATLVVDEAGRLAETSDLWLGSLYWNGSLARPERGKVPLEQWFDHRPMPLIDRENSKDPKLLGTDQHLTPDEGK